MRKRVITQVDGILKAHHGESWMKLIVSGKINGTFPSLRIAILRARGIDNRGVDPELQELKREAARRMRADFNYDRLGELPEIEAWREAYRSFGVKPKDSRPTAEGFLRRLIKGEDFPTISKAVDSYLLAETEYFLPVGGYDLDTITGDIHLRFSDGDEEFMPIGARSIEVTRPGEVVYSDDARILTRKWNYRDCDHSKITEQSTDIGLFTEAPFDSVATSEINNSINRIAELVEKYCGGKAETMFFDVSEMLEISLDLSSPAGGGPADGRRALLYSYGQALFKNIAKDGLLVICYYSDWCPESS
jgi:DNA/RNA-binding domain of Phe-tRNA-synthetase-like protein